MKLPWRRQRDKALAYERLRNNPKRQEIADRVQRAAEDATASASDIRLMLDPYKEAARRKAQQSDGTSDE